MDVPPPVFCVSKSLPQQPLERKRADRRRRCIRAVGCKRFRKQPGASPSRLSPCAATQETQSRLPVPLAPPQEHESDLWSRLFGKTTDRVPSHSKRARRKESV